jgi:hypothetical protein
MRFAAGAVGFVVGLVASFLVETRTMYRADRGSSVADRNAPEELDWLNLPLDELEELKDAIRVARLEREQRLLEAEVVRRLRERRDLAVLAAGARKKDWSAEMRCEVLEALVEVAGARAREVLIDYLREPDADLLESALLRRARFDPEAARDEAAALLAGSRAASLTGEQVASLRRYAGGE